VRDQQGAQPGAGVLGVDGQRLEDDGVHGLPRPGLEQVGDGQHEPDRPAVLLGHVYQLRPDVRAHGEVLGQELLLGDR
jgi:hypothetical protein